MLILPVPENFNELLKYRGEAAVAALSKSSGVVVMTIHLPIVLVIAVLCPESSRTHRACEVIDMVLAVKSSDIRPSQCTTTTTADQV